MEKKQERKKKERSCGWMSKNPVKKRLKHFVDIDLKKKCRKTWTKNKSRNNV